MQLREPGFERWLNANAPTAGPSGMSLSDVETAQEAFVRWPLLDEVECEYVDTPEKARIENLCPCGFEGCPWIKPVFGRKTRNPPLCLFHAAAKSLPSLCGSRGAHVALVSRRQRHFFFAMCITGGIRMSCTVLFGRGIA